MERQKKRGWITGIEFPRRQEVAEMGINYTTLFNALKSNKRQNRAKTEID